MLFRSALFFIFCICRITCQDILQLMQTDSKITLFTEYVNKTDTLSGYFKNPSLTVFVPSDDALKDANLQDKDKKEIYTAHMYNSIVGGNFETIMGTTANWKKYPAIKTVSGITYYTMMAIQNTNRFYMHSSEPNHYCNEAKIISPDNIKGNQVYHVIDRVLMNSGNRRFIDYLTSNTSLSTSARLWSQLDQFALKSSFPSGITYMPEYFDFKPELTGTVLVPTNDAWAKLDQKLVTAMEMDPLQLVTVMNRYFIGKNLVFLRGEADAYFHFGFNTVTNQIPSPGLITKDKQVNIQGRTANVIKGNIPINFGLIHLIDDPMFDVLSATQYLSKNNNAFITKLNSVGNFSMYLSGNYTIMALDDATVNSLTDPNLLLAALHNSFIPGNVRLVPGQTTVTTVGNVTIRLRQQGDNYFIDSLFSQTQNTWINTVKVISLNNPVGPNFVTSLSGYISSLPVTCDQMLRTLNATAYQSLLASNNIKLEVGSPYTLMVPNDVTVNAFTISNNTVPAKSTMMKYILQRMIIANNLVLEMKKAGSFKAATINYAAMKEMLEVTITERNCTVSIYNVQQSFSFADGGFYCYSNTLNDQFRYNLIYPVPFVLHTPLAKIANLCVDIPCEACVPVPSLLLLLVISCLLVLVKSEILV